MCEMVINYGSFQPVLFHVKMIFFEFSWSQLKLYLKDLFDLSE